MRFSRFLDHVAAGDECLYMTTQPLGASEDGRPHLMASPVTEVRTRHAHT